MKKYELRGVSPSKPDVHRALKLIDGGLFPNAFCKAVPDIFFKSDSHCLLIHADGVGTKAIVAYLHYQKHRDPSVFEGIAQDSVVMNTDDLLCVGATGPFLLSNTIGRNAKLIDGDIISSLVKGYSRFSERMSRWEIQIDLCGGETADIGDLVRTLVVDSTVATRMSKGAFIDCSRVSGDKDIIGLASFGQASYEDTYNSGIGTNGFTLLRHELLHGNYALSAPETFSPEIGEHAYCGEFSLDDSLAGSSGTIGEALLSPTRTYAPVIRSVLSRYSDNISAMFHNTGGGQTKCLRFGQGMRYVKDNLFPLPPIFEFIRSRSTLDMSETYQAFNMGHRFEVVCDREVSSEIIGTSRGYNVEARVIGRTERYSGGVSLVIETPDGTVEYKR